VAQFLSQAKLADLYEPISSKGVRNEVFNVSVQGDWNFKTGISRRLWLLLRNVGLSRDRNPSRRLIA
jgi:hypothetical protein